MILVDQMQQGAQTSATSAKSGPQAPPKPAKPTKSPSKTDQIHLSSAAAPTGAANAHAATAKPASPKKPPHLSLWAALGKGLVKSLKSPLTMVKKMLKSPKDFVIGLAAIGVGTAAAAGITAGAVALLGVSAGVAAIGLGVAVAAVAVAFAGYKGYEAAFQAKTQQQKYKDIEGVGEGIGVAADTAALTIAGNAAGGIISDALASRAATAAADADAGDISSGDVSTEGGGGPSDRHTTLAELWSSQDGSAAFSRLRNETVDGAVATLRELWPELFDRLSESAIRGRIESSFMRIDGSATPAQAGEAIANTASEMPYFWFPIQWSSDPPTAEMQQRINDNLGLRFKG